MAGLFARNAGGKQPNQQPERSEKLANKNTRAKRKLAHKNKTHFHGEACCTMFGAKHGTKKHKGPWKGCNKPARAPRREAA